MRGEPWTEDEDAIVGQAYDAGRSDREIAALLAERRSRAWTFAPRVRPDAAEAVDGPAGERTENAVRRRRQTLALTVDARVIDREQLRALHAEGLSSAELARRLGATPRTIQELCSRLRLPLTPGLRAPPHP